MQPVPYQPNHVYYSNAAVTIIIFGRSNVGFTLVYLNFIDRPKKTDCVVFTRVDWYIQWITQIIPVLVKSNQELHERIVDLESAQVTYDAQIADLESANDAKQRRIDELEERVNALVARIEAVENAQLFAHTHLQRVQACLGITTTVPYTPCISNRSASSCVAK